MKIKLIIENSQTKWIDITDEQCIKIKEVLGLTYKDFTYG